MTILVVATAVLGAALVFDRSRRVAVLRLEPDEVPDSPHPSIRDRWVGRRVGATVDDAATIEGVARALRSGASIHAALGEASVGGGALAEQLRAVVAAAGSGRPLADELRRAAASAPVQLRPALRLLAVSIDDGGATADAISRSAAVVRADHSLRADARVQSTQARSSAIAIAGLPLLFVSLSALTAPSVVGFLFGRPLGWLVLAVGLGLDALGWWWMRVLTRRALS